MPENSMELADWNAQLAWLIALTINFRFWSECQRKLLILSKLLLSTIISKALLRKVLLHSRQVYINLILSNHSI